MLCHRKELLVPTPRLKKGLFNRLKNSGENKKDLRSLASRKGIDSLSIPVSLDERISIDLVVLGSVAVDKLGHRIGKGEGFADLEFALAASQHHGLDFGVSGAGAVSENTVVVTTVHDCQVFESLPAQMFQEHDVPVDIIVTPTNIFRVENKLKKPSSINWGILSEQKIGQIPLLQQLKEPCLADIKESDNQTKKRVRKKDAIGFNFSGIPKHIRISEFKEIVRNSGVQKMTFVTWKAYKQSALVFFEGERDTIFESIKDLEVLGNKLTVTEFVEENSNESDKVQAGIKGGKAKKNLRRSTDNDEFGVFFGKIPKTLKKSEFRQMLAERNVQPEHLNWNGRNGYASAFWCKVNEDILDKLENLAVGEQIINVELFKRSKNQSIGIDENRPTTPEKIWKTEVEIDLQCFKKKEETREEDGISNDHCVNSEEDYLRKCSDFSVDIETGNMDDNISEFVKAKDPSAEASVSIIVKEENCGEKFETIPESIPPFCDIIRDIQDPLKDLVCSKKDAQASSYKVQETFAQDRFPVAQDSRPIPTVTRNASTKRDKHATDNAPEKLHDGKSGANKTVSSSRSKALSRSKEKFLSIDTEEDLRRSPKKPSPTRHHKHDRDASAKDKNKQPKRDDKKHKEHREPSSKRGSSSDNKSQQSGGSSKGTEINNAGAVKKSKSSQSITNKAVSKESHPSKTEPSKDKECVVS